MRRTCFNLTLFLKNITRFWPLWAVYLASWLVTLPLATIGAPIRSMLRNGASLAEASYTISNGVVGMQNIAVVMSFLFSAAAAMALFKYLYSQPSVSYYHSLPVTRANLYVTNWLSGLAFLIVPNLLVFGVGCLSSAVYGVAIVSALSWWLLTSCVSGFFFFSFAAFCAQFTGQTITSAAFYGILSFLAPAVYYLMRFFIGQALYGLNTENLDDFFQLLSLWLSPAVSGLSGVYGAVVVEGAKMSVQSWGGAYLITLVAAGLVFALLGLLVYRARRSETAGDFISVPAIKPVFKYGAAFCISLGCALIFEAFTNTEQPFSLAELIIYVTIFGFIICFAADMLIKKTFKVFNKKGFTGWAVFAVVMILFTVVVEKDVFGVERYVPDTERVESVSVSCGGRSFTSDDAQTIADAAELHRQILAENGGEQERDSLTLLFRSGSASDHAEIISVDVSYSMRSGGSVSRSYPVELHGTAGRLAEALINCPAALRDRMPQGLTAEQVQNVNLWQSDGELEGLSVSEGGESVSGSSAYKLYLAMLADVSEGELGRVYFSEDEKWASECWPVTIQLSYLDGDDNWETVTLELMRTADDTLAALRSAGMLEQE